MLGEVSLSRCPGRLPVASNWAPCNSAHLLFSLASRMFRTKFHGFTWMNSSEPVSFGEPLAPHHPCFPSFILISIILLCLCYLSSDSIASNIDLKHKHLLPKFWRLRHPRSRCWQIWLLVRACSLVYRWSLLALSSHGRERAPVSSFSYKGTNPTMWVPTLMTLSNTNYLPKSLSPNIITWGIRVKHMTVPFSQIHSVHRYYYQILLSD